MVDTRKLKDFIKMADLDAGDVIEFLDAGEIVNRDFAKKGEEENIKACLELNVSLNGQESKKMTLNNTTISILNEAWTRVTENWVGKKAEGEKRKILSFGKWIDIMVLEPLVEENRAVPDVEAPPPQEKNFCECGDKAVKAEQQNEENQDVCITCGKPMVAWDEGEG